MQNGKLVTIFSSSYYSGMTNKAACLLIHEGKVRVITLVTDDYHKTEMNQIEARKREASKVGWNEPSDYLIISGLRGPNTYSINASQYNFLILFSNKFFEELCLEFYFENSLKCLGSAST